MEALIVLSPLIVGAVIFWLISRFIKARTGLGPLGYSDAASSRREQKRVDRQMAFAAHDHRNQVAALNRYDQKHGTGWMEGR